jgi:hypothetical protein
MQYRLATLLTVAAVGPPLLAGAWVAANWLASEGNLQQLAVPALFAVGYVGLVTLAVFSKRIARTSIQLYLRTINHQPTGIRTLIPPLIWITVVLTLGAAMCAACILTFAMLRDA